MADKTIVVIGAGIAGLCTGIYARLNGYGAKIVEMHSLPGGLCTAWKRRGYTIDGGIHWLVGSGPGIALHKYWQEVGLIEGREFVHQEEFVTCGDMSGRAFHFYCDPERLEKHMLELSPQDAPAVKEFVNILRFCIGFTMPEKADYEMNGLDRLLLGLTMLPKLGKLQRYMKLTVSEVAGWFKEPLIATAIREVWFPEFSIFSVMVTLAWAQRKLAGYPIGGALPLAETLEKRFKTLGGEITYNARVEKILVENDHAVGVRLEDGSELRGDVVISAADGHATIFEMLGGKYIDDTIRGYYRDYRVTPPLIYIGMGVKRTFADEPAQIMGAMLVLDQPVVLAGKSYQTLPVHIYNYDPTLAPEGKTSVVVALNSSYAYWQDLASRPGTYEAEKEQITATVLSLLEKRWPGISAQVEVKDIATPLTYERYTGNFQGSFTGWMMTPENAMAKLRRTLPGLEDFYMVGQWLVPGGGLPAGVMTAREIIYQVCKKDNQPFHTRTGG